MKPKDFKPQFSWEERQPVIFDGLLTVPQYYEGHETFTFPGWEIFPEKRPVCIEYCSGNGSWLTHRAKSDSERNWVGVEMRFDRVRKIWAKRHNLDLSNLFVVWGEAQTFTRHYIPSHSVAEVFINFPDPWPKKRHEKHRLMKPEFLQELGRILEIGGKVTFVTDDRDYLLWTINHFLADKSFVSTYPDPFYIEEMGDYGSSYFDTLWRDLGRKIHYTQFYNDQR